MPRVTGPIVLVVLTGLTLTTASTSRAQSKVPEWQVVEPELLQHFRYGLDHHVIAQTA